MRGKKAPLFWATMLLIVICITSGVLIFDGVIWFVYPERLGYTVKGIDVARYQGEIDWEIISSQGIYFAFIKATEGSTHIDPMFNSNIVSSRHNGIYASAYHFFSSRSPGKTQAENFIRVIAEHELDMPPVLDFEIPKRDKDDSESIIEEAKQFLHCIEMHYGAKPIIYTTYDSYNTFLSDGFEDYILWFRDLFSIPNIKGGRSWFFWQYSNRGRLNGIDKQQRYVDLNVFYGSIDEFLQQIDEWNSNFSTIRNYSQ